MGSLHARMGTQIVSRNIASIDLGTNSIHLLLVALDEDNALHVLHDSSMVVRMGQGLRETGNIHVDAVTRTKKALTQYQAIIEKHDCKEVFLTTTSAVREAGNQHEVLQALHADIDYRFDVIAKEEEARLSYLSVTYDQPDDQTYVVADIGGGSTEIAWGVGRKLTQGQSVKIGTVKLLEGPLQGDQVNPQQVQHARTEIQNYFQAYDKAPPIDRFFGTAGSFTQLAAIEHALTTYDPHAIDCAPIEKVRIQHWIDTISSMTLQEKKAIPGMHVDRADVALGGLLLAQQLMDHCVVDTCFVRDRGIRYGRAMDEIGTFSGALVFAQDLMV